VAVDHADHRGSEAADDEIVQAALPGVERLATAELQRHEVLLSVGENGDHAECGHADDLPGAPNPQGDGVQVEAKHVDIGQRPGAPGLQFSLERANVSETALFERGAALRSGASAPRTRRVLPPAR
jgi:hypothetical protein